MISNLPSVKAVGILGDKYVDGPRKRAKLWRRKDSLREERAVRVGEVCGTTVLYAWTARVVSCARASPERLCRAVGNVDGHAPPPRSSRFWPGNSSWCPIMPHGTCSTFAVVLRQTLGLTGTKNVAPWCHAAPGPRFREPRRPHLHGTQSPSRLLACDFCRDCGAKNVDAYHGPERVH